MAKLIFPLMNDFYVLDSIYRDISNIYELIKEEKGLSSKENIRPEISETFGALNQIMENIEISQEQNKQIYKNPEIGLDILMLKTFIGVKNKKHKKEITWLINYFN